MVLVQIVGVFVPLVQEAADLAVDVCLFERSFGRASIFKSLARSAIVRATSSRWRLCSRILSASWSRIMKSWPSRAERRRDREQAPDRAPAARTA